MEKDGQFETSNTNFSQFKPLDFQDESRLDQPYFVTSLFTKA
jgi:hypothetical protein